jgi:hypothetical protein
MEIAIDYKMEEERLLEMPVKVEFEDVPAKGFVAWTERYNELEKAYAEKAQQRAIYQIEVTLLILPISKRKFAYACFATRFYCDEQTKSLLVPEEEDNKKKKNKVDKRWKELQKLNGKPVTIAEIENKSICTAIDAIIQATFRLKKTKYAAAVRRLVYIMEDFLGSADFLKDETCSIASQFIRVFKLRESSLAAFPYADNKKGKDELLLVWRHLLAEKPELNKPKLFNGKGRLPDLETVWTVKQIKVLYFFLTN